MSVKHKALGSIKEMLNEKMAGHLKPKMVVDIAVGSKKPGMMEGSPEEEKMESPQEEGMEPDGMHEGMGMGGDISKLDPEERMQLEHLYQKMGC